MTDLPDFSSTTVTWKFGHTREDRFERYLHEIEERDTADSQRAVAPLRKAHDALVIDTGELSVDASLDEIVRQLPARATATAATTAATAAD